MEKFKIISDDPFQILESTRWVLENARFVSVKEENVSSLIEIIRGRFPQGPDKETMGFKSSGSVDNDVQRYFVEDTVNFSFWAGKDEKRWEVEWPAGNIVKGGWFGFTACFDRAIASGVPILDADYLETLSREQGEHFFRSVDGVKIPLLEERVRNLNEAGEILKKRFRGQFRNAVEEADFDAVELVRLILEVFPSFRDVSVLEGREVFFLKRAQLCPNDLNYILEKAGKPIKNLSALTVFADYKIPQILRAHRIIEYAPPLAERVDNYIELPKDSREEIEIRSATIWGAELLRQAIPELSGRQIDNAVWLLSQNQEGLKPYHRTRTIFY